MIRCSFLDGKIRNAFFFRLSRYHQSVDKRVMFLHGSKQLHTAFTPLVFLAVEDVEVLDFLVVNEFPSLVKSSLVVTMHQIRVLAAHQHRHLRGGELEYGDV